MAMSSNQQQRIQEMDTIKGGSGSGNFNHAGRPGEVGGSGEVGDYKTEMVSEPITHSLFSQLLDKGLYAEGNSEARIQFNHWQKPEFADVKKPYAKPLSVLLAKNHGKIVGWGIKVQRKDSTEPEVWRYVLPEYRNQGIGTRINQNFSSTKKSVSIESLKATPSSRLSGFVWSPYQRAYVPVSGKPVDTSGTRKIVDEVRRLAAGRMNKLATRLKDGDLTNTAEFAVEFRDELKNLFVTTHVLARGGLDAMDSSDWGMLGQSLKEQYSYANSMVRDIENGSYGLKDDAGEVIIRDTGIPELGDAFINRVSLYSDSAWGARGEFENVVRDREMALGSLEQRVLDPSAKHCDECIEQSDMGFQPPGILKDLGDCECGPGDSCTFEFENDSLNELAQAFGHTQIGVPGNEPTEQPPFTLYPEKSFKSEWSEEDHPRDNNGKFSDSGAGGDRAERAKSSYIPMTKERWKVASDVEAKVAKIIGGEDTNNNKPFDIIGPGNNAWEIKSVLPGAKSVKCTMHPESLERKLTEAATKGYVPHTIVVDLRGEKVQYYYKSGLGSFRLSSMEKVNSSQLRDIANGRLSH